MSKAIIQTNEVTRHMSGPVRGVRWNVKGGTFALQCATDAVVFDNDGRYLRMEVVWQDVPIVDNAPVIERPESEHAKVLRVK